MTARLQGRTALVTGSTDGIGAGIARAFAARGARVAVNSSSSREAGEALAREIGGVYVQADIADEVAARALVETATAQLGVGARCGVGHAPDD